MGHFPEELSCPDSFGAGRILPVFQDCGNFIGILIGTFLKHFYDNAACVQIDVCAVGASGHMDIK
jgi:hypothetical protein